MITGYLSRFSAPPGAELAVAVSTPAETFEVALVRLEGGDPRTTPQEQRETRIPSAVDGVHRGGEQPLVLGSCAVVPDHAALRGLARFTLHAWVQPTRPAAGVEQVLFARWSEAVGSGFVLGLDAAGHAFGRVGDPELRDVTPLTAGRWYALALVVDRVAGAVELHVAPAEERPADRTRAVAGALSPVAPDVPAELLIAGWRDAGATRPRGAFDGKLEAPTLLAQALTAPQLEVLRAESRVATAARPGLCAAWDFAQETEGDRVLDAGPHALHGRLLNLPTRAATGHAWGGEETAWPHAPQHYGAIHFHVDDVGDAGWEPSFAFRVPEELPSGVYALRLTAPGASRALPFVVTPGTRPRRRVALVLPWFTYLAYANDRALDPRLTRSLYDVHLDGSGCCHSSGLRPLEVLSPEYVSPETHAPRQFAADLFLVHWLDRVGIAYDVLTDDELHRDGAAALEGYDVVLTGSHPEYVSAEWLDALEAHLARGRSLMYLGGNGLYWVTSTHPRLPQAIEVRRGHSGTRVWTSAPGELHHSTTGELGGLWRHRGRAPQRLLGVGFAAMGWSGSAGYRRTPASRDPRWAALVAGLEEGDSFGAYGAIMGGAAGDELDRVDTALGTPPGTVVLASSAGHGAGYETTVEDVGELGSPEAAALRAQIRSDVTVYEHPAGGHVFSVGSMAWCGSLAQDDYANDVARLTTNALRWLLG